MYFSDLIKILISSECNNLFSPLFKKTCLVICYKQYVYSSRVFDLNKGFVLKKYPKKWEKRV